MKQLITLLLVAIFALLPVSTQAQNKDALMSMQPIDRLCFLIRNFEGWHSGGGYVGWGHQVQPGEHLPLNITRAQADSLLYEDLLKLLKRFQKYGGDYALLLTAVAYNCGYARVEGGGKYKPSRLIQKIKQGRKDIEADYLDFCRVKNKIVPSIRRRQWVEFHYLYVYAH